MMTNEETNMPQAEETVSEGLTRVTTTIAFAAHDQDGDEGKAGLLNRIDRFCRRLVPGYNYIRTRRGRSRTSLHARSVSSSYLVSAKIRSRVANARRSRAQGNEDVYLETGISKTEFCLKLDYLLRKKLEQQQEGGMLVGGVHFHNFVDDEQEEDTRQEERMLRPEVTRSELTHAELAHPQVPRPKVSRPKVPLPKGSFPKVSWPKGSLYVESRPEESRHEESRPEEQRAGAIQEAGVQAKGAPPVQEAQQQVNAGPNQDRNVAQPAEMHASGQDAKEL